MKQSGSLDRTGRQIGGRVTAKSATIEDVATRVGVSIMTVSRAMRGVEGVSAARRAQILRVARDIGYTPNRNAGLLAGQGSTLIGISLPTLFDDVFAEILDGMRGAFDLAGFDTVIDTTDYCAKREAGWVDRMLAWRPAGLILSGVHHSRGVRRRLKASGIPILEIWDYSDDPIDLCVGIDHEAAGYLVGRHLAGLGYRKPAYVGTSIGRDMRAEERLGGYKRAFAEMGIHHVREVRAKHHTSFKTGLAGTLSLIGGSLPADAIFYLNDHMAFGGLAACRRRGLDAPHDIGIVGFNGLGINSVLPRPLPTVVTPRSLMGAMGARYLIARINGVRTERRTAMPVKLFPGATTRQVCPAAGVATEN